MNSDCPVLGDHVRFESDGQRAIWLASNKIDDERVLVVCQKSSQVRAEQIASLCHGSPSIFTVTESHAPAAVMEAARAQAQEHQVDYVLAVGGGSAIGIAKLVVLERHCKFGVVATTFSGSEMTDIWGMTKNGQKVTGRAPTFGRLG